MTIDGAIDCDIHPGVPEIKALLPYMNDFWQESFIARGLDGFDMMSYPLGSPIACRPDWRVKGERPGSSLSGMQRDALDAFGISLAICNPLTGGQVAASESMGAAIHRRLNEELGLSCTLQFLFKFRYQAQYDAASAEHEFCSVFFGRSAEGVNANGEEIADWRWMGINEVQEELAGVADAYTPWFKLEWERIRRDHLGEVLSPGGMRTWASR